MLLVKHRLVNKVLTVWLTLIISSIASAQCLEEIDTLSVGKQLLCLKTIKSTGSFNTDVNAGLTRFFRKMDGKTNHRVVAGALDLLRAQGHSAHAMAEVLSQLLPHQAKLYQQRDKWYVLRLRAYIFLTLSEVGYPDSAVPMLIDTISHFDNRMSAVELGSVMRVVASLGARGQKFSDYLLDTIGDTVGEEEFSLSRYAVDFPREESTTVQIEAVRALRAIGASNNKRVMTALTSIAQAGSHSSLDPRLIHEAKLTLQHYGGLNTKNNHVQLIPTAYVSPWLLPEQRHAVHNLDINFTDHAGKKKILSNIVDRPTLVAFFYTRCQNAGKCSMTLTKLASLQKELQKQGLDKFVRLLAITYEPQYDNSLRLRRYAIDRGFKLSDNALTVRLDPDRHVKFVKEIENPVGYNAGWVNSHGVEATLLDSHGRLVRKYTSQYWLNETVTSDLKRLLLDS